MEKVQSGFLNSNYVIESSANPLEKINRLKAILRRWSWNYQQRQQLREIPDFLLRDMGISRKDLHREIKKPFWRN